jgi:hypothetical protein
MWLAQRQALVWWGPFITLFPEPKDVAFARLEDEEDSLNMPVSSFSLL